MANDFDVVVVGSGFGGSVSAARLAERGLRVLILERGPWWGPLQRHRPADQRRELPRGLLGSRKLLRNLRVARRGRRFEKLFHADGLLEAHRFEHLSTITASGVGGGSHVYTAILEAPEPGFWGVFPPEITAADMRPYFDRVRAVLRPSPVPSEPAKDRALARAVNAAGLPALERPPLGIAWGSDPERPETVINAAGVEQRSSSWRGDALVGCDDGSKTTLDITYVPLALKSGAELRPLCEVRAIQEVDGGYEVRYRDHRRGDDREEVAPRVVLAAGGLNTQRLLFAARDDHGGLPRLPATLGTRFSPNADSASLLWRTEAVDDSSDGPAFAALSRVMRDGAPRFVVGAVGLPLQALPVGPLRRALMRSVLLFAMGRDASTGTLGFDGEGLISDVGRSLDPDLFGEIEAALDEVGEHYGARRLLSRFLCGGDPEGLFSVHPLGGCSMGRSPEDGFTDHRGQVFHHPGLYIADGSLYPRAPGIAPSLTIAALAERQAELID